MIGDLKGYVLVISEATCFQLALTTAGLLFAQNKALLASTDKHPKGDHTVGLFLALLRDGHQVVVTLHTLRSSSILPHPCPGHGPIEGFTNWHISMVSVAHSGHKISNVPCQNTTVESF